MLRLLAILFPPLAVFICGKPRQLLANVALTLCLLIPGIVHALFIVNNHYVGLQADRTVVEMQRHRLDSVLRRM